MRGTAYWSPRSPLIPVSTNPTQNQNGSILLDRAVFLCLGLLCGINRRGSGLGWCDLFLGHQFAQFARFIHFHHDIAAADKFAFDI
jgi:hypothetical protein